MSQQVFEDLQMTTNALMGLLDFVAKDARVKGMNLYVLPCRLNQDFVEGYFGLQRSTGGCSTNMTAHRYGYQSLALMQTHILPQNLHSAALDVPLPTGKQQ